MLQSQYEHGRSHSDYGGTIRCRLCRQRFAHVEDPAPRRVYLLVEQGKTPTLSDDYFSAKIAFAIAERDRGECEPWDVEQLKADCDVATPRVPRSAEMLKIVRTPAAVRDLAAITDYIAADTLSAALAFYDEIDGLLTVLAQYPDMGEVVDNLSPGLRRFTPGN